MHSGGDNRSGRPGWPPVFKPANPLTTSAAQARLIAGGSSRPHWPPVYHPAPAKGIQPKGLEPVRQSSAPPVYRPEAAGTAQPKTAVPKAPPVYRPNPAPPRHGQPGGAVQRMRWTKSGQDIVPADPGYKLAPKPPIPEFHKWEDGDVWDDETGTLHRSLNNLFKRKAEAYEVHNDALDAERGSGAIHGRSRHGYQTGIEGQLERAASKTTPDQPNDPLGVGGTIRKWTTSGKVRKMINDNGVVIDESAYKPPRRPPKVRKSGGPYAGSFFSPEIQNRLIAVALIKAAPFLAWEEAQFESGWVKIAFLDVVLQEQPGGYGVAFSNKKGMDTEYAIKITYDENAPIATRSSVTANVGGERDAIQYTPHGMDVYLMKCAKVQLRRGGAGWEVLSAFPENLSPGVAPIYRHGEELWTGKVRNTAQGKEADLVVPAWPKKEK